MQAGDGAGEGADNNHVDATSVATGKPTFARLYRVAAGLAEWTPEEKAWLAQNPNWIRHEKRIRDALTARGAVDSLSESHVDRVTNSSKTNPPSRT